MHGKGYSVGDPDSQVKYKDQVATIGIRLKSACKTSRTGKVYVTNNWLYIRRQPNGLRTRSLHAGAVMIITTRDIFSFPVPSHDTTAAVPFHISSLDTLARIPYMPVFVSIT